LQTHLPTLLAQHPLLLSQLQEIYTATLPPSATNAPKFYKPVKGSGFKGRHRERVAGPWTREKGDEAALKIIGRARRSTGRDGEGMGEFVALVLGSGIGKG